MTINQPFDTVATLIFLITLLILLSVAVPVLTAVVSTAVVPTVASFMVLSIAFLLKFGVVGK